MKNLLRIALVLASTSLVACTQEPPVSGGGGSGSDPGGGSGSGSDPGGGSGSGSDPGGTSSLTPEDFIAQLVGQECAHALTCRAQYPATPGDTFEDEYGTDQNDCVTSDDDYGARAQVTAAIAAGKIDWDPTAGEACLADLMFPATCADFFANWEYPDTCYDALSGNTADGGACATDWECSGDNSVCTAAKCAPDTTP